MANATPGQQDAIFLPPFIFVAVKERCLKNLVEINLVPHNIQENSIFSSIHFIHFIVIIESMK